MFWVEIIRSTPNLVWKCIWSATQLIIFWADRLIDYLRFYVPIKNFSLIWRRHHYQWRAAKFRPMLGAQGLWAGRDIYRATPTVTRDLGFTGIIRRTAPFSRLLRHTRGCGGLDLYGWHLQVKICLPQGQILKSTVPYGTISCSTSYESPWCVLSKSTNILTLWRHLVMS
jgi:hypothetical protein